MMRKSCLFTVLLTALLGLMTLDAAAWGPKAQRAITGTAIQVIRRSFPSAFKTYENNYEDDVLRGSLDGAAMLNTEEAFSNRANALSAIDNEIQLLREVRQYGFGSYLSYRMGVLASLVADLKLPFALSTAKSEELLRKAIEKDIDVQLATYRFSPSRDQRVYVRSAEEYFKGENPFYEDTKKIIADDYRRGKGYQGYLLKGGEALFCRATEACANVWFTVLRVEGEAGDIPPSADLVTWYLVDEIRYLLEVKKNYHEATKAYASFDKVNPGIPETYERLGDLFYAYGTEEAKERAIGEWEIAYNTTPTDRSRIGRKLADHWTRVGDAYYEQAFEPGASDEELPNALNAFTKSLEFNPANEEAASRISETKKAIAERRERREMNVNILASAEKVKIQADQSRVKKDFGNAIATYNQAVGLFRLIDEEFIDQAKTAQQSIKELNKAVTDVINEVLNAASDAIDEGDRLVDERNFAGAVSAYERVPGIVKVIPGDESTAHGREKKELTENSKQKIEEARKAEQRWQEMERQRAEEAAAAAAANK